MRLALDSLQITAKTAGPGALVLCRDASLGGFGSPNFVAGSVLMFGVGMILTGTLALLPSMLQVLLNYPVFDAGGMMAPRSEARVFPRRPSVLSALPPQRGLGVGSILTLA